MWKQNNHKKNGMKKLFLIVTLLMSIGILEAQEVVEDFNIGPYEVYYKGQGDVIFRLKKGVDLYEYFGLKKDTIINVVDVKPEPLKHGLQLSIFGETGMYRCSRYSMAYGIGVSWKQRIANQLYFNGGLSLGYSGTTITNQKDNVLEIGVPLSVEWSNLYLKKASLYLGAGMSPTYYSTMSAEYTTASEGVSPEKYNGLYITPCLEVGAYVPVGKQIVKVGMFWRHKINCTTKDYDLYYQIIGRTFIGANIGIIF